MQIEHSKRTRAFTLVELLVVMAIIAMMVTAMIPAVQSMRSSARRTQCRNQLLQLVLAAQNYEMAHEHFPAGVTDPASGPIQNVAAGMHQGWITAVLPYIDEGNAYRQLDFEKSVYAAENKAVRDLTIRMLACPAESSGATNASSYAACHHPVEAPINSDNRGVFYLNSRTSIDDIRDGLSQTILLGEKLVEKNDLGWMSGTRATLRNTGSPINALRGGGQPVRNSEDPIEPTYQRGYFNSYGGYGDGYGDDEIEEEEEDQDEGLDAVDEDEADSEAGSNNSPDAPVDEADDEMQDDADSDEDVAEDDNGEDDYGEELAATEEDEDADPPLKVRPPRTRLSVGGFASYHSGGAFFAFADGRIQFIEPDIDARVYSLLGDHDDGTLLNPSDYRE